MYVLGMENDQNSFKNPMKNIIPLRLRFIYSYFLCKKSMKTHIIIKYSNNQNQRAKKCSINIYLHKMEFTSTNRYITNI